MNFTENNQGKFQIQQLPMLYLERDKYHNQRPNFQPLFSQKGKQCWPKTYNSLPCRLTSQINENVLFKTHSGNT